MMEKDQSRVAAMGDSNDSRTAAGNEATPAPNDACRHCYRPKAQHRAVEDPTDVLAPHILICPKATYEEMAWYDK